MKRVKSKLAVLMAERDPRMSQRALAEKSGVSTMAVNRLYNNDFKRVDTETLEKLCAFLECDLSDLLVLKAEQISNNKSGRSPDERDRARRWET
ncbi:XRE family transcriptional regulator [Chlorogloea sp. CCALA 695]|nr:XRE family transcriptional regulator [Chlorogloea sp. CCALA 695]